MQTWESSIWSARSSQKYRRPRVAHRGGGFVSDEAPGSSDRAGAPGPKANNALAVIPYQESIMIMRHGTKHWRAWKAGGEPVCACCRRGEIKC